MGGLSGTVTFLFTDIEGSTRLWEALPVAMQGALARHDDIVRAAVESHRGQVVKGAGDGGLCVFSAARDALEAAVAAQTAMSTEPWGATGPLHVRMGIHTGEAEYRDGDYFGPVLNRAARLMAIAHGGQILCTRATADLVRDAMPGSVSVIDLGEHRLRDLSRPEHVFQVTAPDLPVEFPPLVSLDSFPGNLPLQVSSFIGRERELSRVATAIKDARVVTLTGVGGVGKTRLALQVAADVLPEFREGAWFIELAPIRDPAAVSGAFADLFGVSTRAGRSLEDGLIEFLGSKRLLLVVDNCEHLLESAADLIDCLERSCAGVRILATSREGLGLDGERIIPIPSLSAPASDTDLATAGQSDAVRLFVERAIAVDPDFELTVHNANAVAQVCRRLDGIPLAIELAAARVAAMNLSELAAGLDRRFDTLSGGRRRAVQRHQTLRAAIDWSYNLCSEPERRLLARLAVFAGGCTRAAAEAVCGTPPIQPSSTFELLATLVARSLVVAERDRPETRYRLLETLREYGEDRLAEHLETDPVRMSHVDYYIDFAAVVGEQLAGPNQLEAGRRFVAEHENLLAALRYAIDMDDADRALRLVANLPAPMNQTGYTLRVPIEPIFSLTGASDHVLYPYVIAVGAVQAAVGGDFATATTRMELSFDAARRLGDPEQRVEALALNTRMFLAFGTGATHDAARCAERLAELSRANGRQGAVAIALSSAATFHTMAGDIDAALPLATEGLAIARDLGTPSFISVSLNALAAALADRDPPRARAMLHESIERRALLGDENMAEITQAALISARLEDWPGALALAEPAIRHLHWGASWPLLAAIINIVARAVVSDAPETAAILQGIARQLITTTRLQPDPDGVHLVATGTVAGDATPQGSTARDFVTGLRRETSAILRQTITEQRLRDLRSEGEQMQRDDAIAYTLDAIADRRDRAWGISVGTGPPKGPRS